jgi:hypothetical protein
MDPRTCHEQSTKRSCACMTEGLFYRGKRLVNWDPGAAHRRLGSRGVVRGRETVRSGHIR